MGYTALYREWRPQQFSEIVGQVHISRTLQNAVMTGRIAHAYLFCGPRGTGKTTSAKVLAKTLNCLNPVDSEPCNECENCKRVTEGTSMDVMEIDAASNRGIDEIRDLREKVKFAPSEGRYRIYIIDEVHMLTTEAFNALLKTLEEPPAHVIFVLATTEPHKIPTTVLSRCQRFDFRSIGQTDIVGRLRTVVDELGITVQEEALELIARSAEGGMRDALSILDQCISFGGQAVSTEDVNSVLGTVNSEFLLKITDSFLDYDVTAGLTLVDNLVRQGKDIRQFTKDLTQHFRNLLLAEVCGESNDLIPVSADLLGEMKKAASRLGRKRIIALIELFTSAEREMKWTSQPRLVLELAVIKAGDRVLSDDYSELVERICRLESALAGAQLGPTNVVGAKPSKTTSEVGKTVSRQKTLSPEATTQVAALNSEGREFQSVDIDTVKKCWQEILQRIKKVRMSAKAFLIEGQPVNIKEGTLILTFPAEYAFHKEKVEHPENRNAIEQVIREVTGGNLKILCKFENEISHGPSDKSDKSNGLVDEAIRLFGGEVIEIND